MREKPKLLSLSLSLSRFQSETEKKIQIQKKKANRSRDALVISSLLVPFRAVCCAALHDWAARTLRTFFSISTLLLVIYKPSRAYNFHIITHFLLFFSLSLSVPQQIFRDGKFPVDGPDEIRFERQSFFNSTDFFKCQNE